MKNKEKEMFEGKIKLQRFRKIWKKEAKHKQNKILQVAFIYLLFIYLLTLSSPDL